MVEELERCKEIMEDVGRGQPKIADNVILIDFDGTLYPWGHMFCYPEPLPGAVKAVKKFKDKGYTIVIFTSRLSEQWLEVEGEKWYNHVEYIKDILHRDGIPYDFITSEKIPATHYIDDKAHRFDNNWDELAEIITS